MIPDPARLRRRLEQESVPASVKTLDRKTTYPGFSEARKTQSEWRAYFDFAVGGAVRPSKS